MSLERKILSIDEAIAIFDSEFASVRPKFIVQTVGLMEVEESPDPLINRPGVYVHWKPEIGVIKVGKSQSNAKSRAFNHLRDNTHTNEFAMKDLKDDISAKLLLFNIRLDGDIHWILSAEAFLDKALYPLIPSGRIG